MSDKCNLRAVRSAWHRYPWLGLHAAKSGVTRGVFSHAEDWIREDEIMRLHKPGEKPGAAGRRGADSAERSLFPVACNRVLEIFPILA